MYKAIKLNHINNLSDARYCAGMGVHMLGFAIDPYYKNYLTAEKLHAITAWISGVKIVGEISEVHIDDTFLKKYVLDVIQIEENTIIKSKKFITKKNIKIIRKICVKTVKSILELEKKLLYLSAITDYFLISTTLKKLYIPLLQKHIVYLAKKYPIIQDFNISPNSINYILTLPLYGIAFDGENEIRPGYKSYKNMSAILEKIVDYNARV